VRRLQRQRLHRSSTRPIPALVLVFFLLLLLLLLYPTFLLLHNLLLSYGFPFPLPLPLFVPLLTKSGIRQQQWKFHHVLVQTFCLRHL
jgi:hypothetical protein